MLDLPNISTEQTQEVHIFNDALNYVPSIIFFNTSFLYARHHEFCIFLLVHSYSMLNWIDWNELLTIHCNSLIFQLPLPKLIDDRPFQVSEIFKVHQVNSIWLNHCVNTTLIDNAYSGDFFSWSDSKGATNHPNLATKIFWPLQIELLIRWAWWHCGCRTDH